MRTSEIKIPKNTIKYLKTRYLPTGYDENKLIYEVNRSYGKNADMFGMKRGDYKPYNEYKKSKSNSNETKKANSIN